MSASCDVISVGTPAPRPQTADVVRAAAARRGQSARKRAGSPRAAEEKESGVRHPDQLLADLRRENDALLLKLARVSQAMRALALDLATSRRELRRKQRELDSLRSRPGSPGLASTTGIADRPTSDPERLQSEVRRLGARYRARGSGGPEKA
ncbi:MAG TPA: hypothetical protein VMB05_14060 [Solirubrobacteraceae bacterium]|nr:hypothetical protein [Solirubrobacteraceae bacterium]